jgi:hypothetical protein
MFIAKKLNKNGNWDSISLIDEAGHFRGEARFEFKHEAQKYVNCLRTLRPENAMIIVNYIQAVRTEINLSDNYRKLNIFLLSDLSKFHNDNNNKPFKQMSRDDILHIWIV